MFENLSGQNSQLKKLTLIFLVEILNNFENQDPLIIEIVSKLDLFFELLFSNAVYVQEDLENDQIENQFSEQNYQNNFFDYEC